VNRRAALSSLLLAAPACAGVTTTSGDAGAPIDWSGQVEVALDLAAAVDPAIRAQVDADTALTPPQRAAIDQALAAVAASIPALRAAVQAYRDAHAAPSALCGLWSVLHDAISARLAVVTALQAAGLAIPSAVALLVGALGALADSLLPRCAPARAEIAREMPRIEAAFARVTLR
jgi:hypothetical protein